ncbi:MAG: M20/M25/M40 family metallo-hydrolase [Planctomycetes bacterium]|nr:M20/M25/M40 family metallo-hydrolase [Planctomycetota bacterium]
MDPAASKRARRKVAARHTAGSGFALLPALLAAAALAALAAPGSARAQDAAATVTAREIQAHVEFLASDLLEGRDSGKRGAELAALYIETQFELLGLRPLCASWQMPFDIGRGATRMRCVLSCGGRIQREGEQVAAREFSGCGEAQGQAALATAAPGGRVVVAAEQGGEDEDRALAEDLARRGALAVVFVSSEPRFGRRRGDGRRSSGAATAGDEEGSVAAGATLETLAAAGGPGEAIPALRAASALAASLVEAAEQGGEIAVAVAREGASVSANVVGVLEGSDPILRNEYVLVGAHYDHVGRNDLGKIYNGADDNASGVAGVLELAGALASLPRAPRRSVIFAAWGAEERGLIGSQAFARDPPVPLEQIAACINLDMISRNDARLVEVVHASDDLLLLAEEAAARHGLAPKAGLAFLLAASDSLPFVQNEVPTLFLFTGMHADLHAPTDDAGRIDSDKAARVARTALAVLLAVANGDARPAYTTPGLGVGSSSARGRRLGFVPAADASGGGVAVSAVSAGSVAARAGLQTGDVIVRVGAAPIAGSRDLRDALNALAAAEPFEIEVRRQGESVVLKAAFAE